MEMEEYKSNSHKARDRNDEKKVEKVVIGSAKTKPKTGLQKMASSFIAEDIGDVKSYILMDVLIPSIKDAIWAIGTNGLSMLIYGETGRIKKPSSGTKVSYGDYYSSRNRKQERHEEPRLRTGFDYDDIVFDTRGDAEAVLIAMEDILDRFGIVSIADFYDLADVSTNNYQLGKYGWTNLRAAKTIKVADGWVLKLPRATPIN